MEQLTRSWGVGGHDQRVLDSYFKQADSETVDVVLHDVGILRPDALPTGIFS